MKVYHGTNIVIEQPQIINRFKTLDFGEGFYTTENGTLSYLKFTHSYKMEVGHER